MEILTILLFGLFIGSFYNVLIFRIPKKENFIKGRSYCPNCNTKLTFWDLIPVFSFLFLKGKCRYCKNKISVQYISVEILNSLLFVGFYLKFGINKNFFAYSFIFSLFFVIITTYVKINIKQSALSKEKK